MSLPRQTLTLARLQRGAHRLLQAQPRSFLMRNLAVCHTRNLATESKSSSHDEFTNAEDVRRKRAHKQRQDDDHTDAVREKILTHALDHVNELGWSREAISAGARDAGLPGVTSGLASASGGGVDLLHFHTRRSNAALTTHMTAEVARIKTSGDRLRIRPFIRGQCEARLRMNAPFLGRWTQALALQSLPQNLPDSLHFDLELMDDIWHFAGDKATDMNWYTKRLSLLPMYKATELAMIEDKSEDFSETWKFLDRRFEDEISAANFLIGAIKSGSSVGAAATTLQNMLGLQRK